MRFSVITPSFQNSDRLKLCVASVADQANVVVEHIVQDAGSTDGTLDWLVNDSRVKAYVEKDQGMYDAINRGLLKASGDILAHLNCDEQYLPGTLEAVADYFEGHPRTDIVFADAIVVDHRGEYICHRKVISPSKYHTWLCHLGTLTCGTFFRRKLIDEQKLFFDTRWRVIGDAYWILQILERRVPMGVLRRFASSFTDHDTNLSLEPLAAKEAKDLIRSAPGWAQKLRKLFVLQHRMRRALSGIYRQAPFTYSIYTEQSPDTRVLHTVSKPTFLWRSRL